MKRLGLLLIIVIALAGCGFGAGKKTGGSVTVAVTQNFGRAQLVPTSRQTASEGETVMRLLQRSSDVKTRYGGNFVQEIDGVSGGREDGRRVDWFYYVNGIESSIGAGERKLHPGDRVWWDHHDWETAMRVPAVVGAFPEPFRSGQDGKKLPIRLVCFAAEDRSCNEVEQRLSGAGVRNVARSNLESSPGEVLRILVGKWSDVRKDIASRQLEEGPEVSGVFAKPNAAGNSIALMNPDGQVERTLGPGSGLVAATSYQEDHPTWIVTGTDDVGVAAAAAALNEDQLRYHFAVAIDAGRGVPLPLEAP
ncbi:DUF4430 domain-containing protein [Solirubrobacter soli]|uniref:DUF4430 domain-containing protein n=1 Tax=Solirubrobacter soli TaxID=363832 RepID=UPI000405F401|nr:DUF4430 domain-containing protein [Solirubrobacter soli]